MPNVRCGQVGFAVVALVLASCGSAGDRIAAPNPALTVTTATTSRAPGSTAGAPTTTTEATTTTDAGVDTAPDGDGPFGLAPGRGRIAPAPPPGPLVDGSRATRAAVVVKLDNIAEAWPQAGVNQADVTFELLVEGVSRFAAVFNSEEATLVGPVRSARTSDIDVVAMLGRPCFAASGGNDAVMAAVAAGPLVNISADVAAGAYERDADREMPHNLMTATPALRAACDGSGLPDAIFEYRGDGRAAGGDEAGFDARVDVGGVAVRLGASAFRFVWDQPAGRWLRFVDEYAHVDTRGVQVSPTNVVVLETEYAPSPADPRSPEAQTLGSGAAWVLVDGLAATGTWERFDPTEPYALIGEDGAALTLRPGRTWVVLAPPDTAELLDPAAALD